MKHEARLTRRDLLKLAVTTGALSLIQACAGGGQSTPTAAPQTAAKPAAQATAAPTVGVPAPTQAPTAIPTKEVGPKRGGTFTVAKTAAIEHFDPMRATSGHYAYQRALYNTLVRLDLDLKPQPELATKWALSADGKAITLELRQGVKFHSGREFTADDVKFCFDFAKTNERNTYLSFYQRNVKQVDVTGKYTVVVRFNDITPGVFDLLDWLFIVDKETIGDITKTANGTGPFKLEKYIPNDRVEMVAFKDYWDEGKPYLDKYVLRQIPDVSSLVINLESGAVDCIWQLSYLDTVRLKDTKKFVINPGAPGTGMFCLLINVEKEPFTNKKVRQAISWSVDRARFCRTTLQGMAEPTCLMWPANSWAYFKDLEGKITFDLGKAAALLSDAGLGKGFSTQIMTASQRSYGYGDLAQILQADLKKIGVDAPVSDLEVAQFNTRYRKGEMPITVMHYSRLARHPATMVTATVAWASKEEQGPTQFKSAEYNRLRQELQLATDQEKAKAISRSIQELALDECFVIPVSQLPRPWAYADYVRGFGYDLEDSPLVGNVWLDK